MHSQYERKINEKGNYFGGGGGVKAAEGKSRVLRGRKGGEHFGVFGCGFYTRVWGGETGGGREGEREEGRGMGKEGEEVKEEKDEEDDSK